MRQLKRDLQEILSNNISSTGKNQWKADLMPIKAEMAKRGIRGTIQIMYTDNDDGETERITMFHRDNVGDYTEVYVETNRKEPESLLKSLTKIHKKLTRVINELKERTD